MRTRKVIRRNRDLVEMEERGVMAFPFVARFLVRLRPPDAWEADARSNMGHTHNTYRLFSDTEGTRLEMTFDVYLTGPYRLFAPFARGFIVRKTAQEWDDYVHAMQSGRELQVRKPTPVIDFLNPTLRRLRERCRREQLNRQF